MRKTAAAKKGHAAVREKKTAVTTGWIVKKRYKRTEPDPDHAGKSLVTTYEKTISKTFTSEGAAKTFRDLTAKYPPLALLGEHDAEFYVTEHAGHDDLPPGL